MLLKNRSVNVSVLKMLKKLIALHLTLTKLETPSITVKYTDSIYPECIFFASTLFLLWSGRITAHFRE